MAGQPIPPLAGETFPCALGEPAADGNASIAREVKALAASTGRDW